ncbi:hypothetical protein ACFQ1S_23480, partial [Kibdelosporangium lantanae]
MKRFIRGLLGIVIVLALWQLGSFTGLFDSNYIPPPSTVLPRVFQLFTGEFNNGQDEFVRDFVATMATWFVTLLIAIMYALFGAAIVIAAFGVVNTLALSVMERTRELGV